jgi:hypothetical protein
MERVAAWRLIGHVEPAPDPEALAWEIGLQMRDAGLLGEPVVSYSLSDDGDRRLHLDWPSVAEHAEDPEWGRLLALARLPLDRSCPELDDTPRTTPEEEAAIERLAAEDRATRALVAKAGKLVASVFLARQAATRRTNRKSKRQADPEIFEGTLTSGGWRWKRAPGSGSRLRARLRR